MATTQRHASVMRTAGRQLQIEFGLNTPVGKPPSSWGHPSLPGDDDT